MSTGSNPGIMPSPSPFDDLLDHDSPTQSSGGWSIVRNVIDYRVKGKIFQKGELEDDGEYASFRMFNEVDGERSDENSINVLRVSAEGKTFG